MSFTDEEVAYLRSQPLGRLATVSRDGQPDVVPVGYDFDGTYLYVSGHGDTVKTRKFRLSRLDASASVGSIAVMLLITGLGIGLFTSPNSSAILGAAPPRRRGVANGVLGTARMLGMVLGIGVAGAVYTTTLGLIGDASGARRRC